MTAPSTQEVPCPKCGGRTWDNRLTKRNPKQPDFKCRDRACDGAIWPPKNAPAPQKVSGTISPSASKKSISQTYTECVDFVLEKIVPKFMDAEIGVSDVSVASMIATVFIARRKEER